MKIQTFTLKEQRAQNEGCPSRGESHPKSPQSHPGLDHLWGLLCSSCPTWEPPFVLAVLGEQLLVPHMPTESHSCLEGQRDKPFHKAQGPLRWVLWGNVFWGYPPYLLPHPHPRHPRCRPVLYSEAICPGGCRIYYGATARGNHQGSADLTRLWDTAQTKER